MATVADLVSAAWDAGGNNGLDRLLARAFGIEGGYLELNGILTGAKYLTTFKDDEFNLFEDLGLYDSPMLIVVGRLREEIKSAGEQRPALEAIFLAVPGNFELRTWAGSQAADLLSLVSQAEFEAARPAYEADRLKRRIGGIEKALTALAPSVALNAADKQLASDIMDRLDELNGYKSVHDALHQLQMSVMGEFVRLTGELIPPVERELSIELQLEEMKLAVDRIRRQFSGINASQAALQTRDAVIGEITRIATLIGSLEAGQRETAETAAGLLRAMLRQQMSLFDSRLVETSEQIPFEKFARAIVNLPQPAIPRAAEDNPALLGNVSSSFEDVALRLSNRQKIHRMWQQAEATMLNIEELLRGTGREVEIRFHWENLELLIKQIAELAAEPDVAKLLTIPNLDLAQSSKAEEVRSAPFGEAFKGFTRFARVRFQRADNALLEDCAQLRKLHNPLQQLL